MLFSKRVHAFLKKGTCFSKIACTLLFFYILYYMDKTYPFDEPAPFRIKAYGIQELGQMYFPNSTPRSASSQLKKWINHNGQRILTPKQVRIMVKHLDPP